MYNNQNINLADQKMRDSKESYRSMMQFAYVFSIIGMVFSAFIFLFPLIWTIPIMIKTKDKFNASEPQPTMALGIISLFFSSFIGGIFAIIADSYATNYRLAKEEFIVSNLNNNEENNGFNNFANN